MSTFEQKLFNSLRPSRGPVRKRRKGGARRGRVVDTAYLAWMAQQPPMVGSGPVTVHHVRRFGEPKDDRRTVPLPAEYHMHDFGPNAIERIGKAAFQELLGVDLETAIVVYNDAYERETREPECCCIPVAADEWDARYCQAHNQPREYATYTGVPNGDTCPF
jgi:hypothetical protein